MKTIMFQNEPRQLVKKMHMVARLFSALLLSSLCSSVWSLDLSQAYRAALLQDTTLRAAQAAADSRGERVPQTLAQLLPNISVSATRNSNALQSVTPNFLGQAVTANTNYGSSNTALTLRQPLFRKYLAADYRQAKAQAVEANANLEKESRNLAVRVSGAYFEALLTADQVALILAQKIAFASQLDAAEKRFTAGAGTRTDIDEARAALDLNFAQELEARQAVDFTRRVLQALINQPIDNLAALDADKLVPAPPVPNQLEDWTERAQAQSPEILALQSQLEAASYEVEKASAGHHPTLDAIAQMTQSVSDTVTSVSNRYSNKSIGLQLNFPLYSGGSVSSLIRQALADKERVAQQLEGMRRDLGVRVHKEFRGVTEGVLKIAALEQAVRSTGQVALSNRRAYEAGSRTLNNTLNAEQLKVAAERDLAQARYGYLISKVRLQALAGGDKAEVIDEINGLLKR